MNKQTELLFDTTALIDIYRGLAIIKPRFDAILNGDVTPYLSVITEAELWRGLRVDEVERHNAILARFVALPLDSNAARLAGSWMQKYAAAGLGWMDALIAASGKVAGLPLLTRDSRLARVLSVEVEFELYAL
ncbi:MAG: PIN domain-containing protein [Chloroflexota bacterium]